MIKKVLTYALLFLGLVACAQDSSEAELRSDRYVYLNAGALLNIPAGVQVGYEQRIRNNWYWDIEGGVLLFSKIPTIMDFNARNKRGMRFQTGAKVILTDHFFIGPQFLYKRVTMDEDEWFVRFENEYEQRFNTERIRRTYALATEIGWQFNSDDSPTSVEICYAFGIQNFNVSYKNILPDDISFNQLNEVGSRPGTSIYPFFNYRVKIKYALNWRNPNEDKVENQAQESRTRKSKRRTKGKKQARP